MIDIQNYLKEDELRIILNKYVIHRNHDHEANVALAAVGLFDALKTTCDFGSEERNLLKYSAILHDIGYYIDEKMHHEHTKYIILADQLLKNVPEKTRSMLAVVAGGHRRSIPDEINAFDSATQENLLGLIALLRTADVLDDRCVAGFRIQQGTKKNDKLVINLNKGCSESVCKKINRKTELLKEKFLLDIKILPD